LAVDCVLSCGVPCLGVHGGRQMLYGHAIRPCYTMRQEHNCSMLLDALRELRWRSLGDRSWVSEVTSGMVDIERNGIFILGP
jgi:hypothetical protein